MIQTEIQKSVEIVDTLELPISGNQISLEISFEGLLKEFHGRITNASGVNERISALQSLFGKQEPVERVVFSGLHRRGRPLATMVS
ncbi:MAG: hypothetical protein NTW91_08085 [Verrucomicrobia bacterium]|nr:hypothetical protein [Verrucomicrobiota bacterium]